MKICLIVFLLGFTFSSYGQMSMREGKCNSKGIVLCPKHSFFHETNTTFNGLSFNSLNYDYVIICASRYMITGRLGFAYWMFKQVRSMGVPVELNVCFGSGANLLEVSGGYTVFWFRKNYSEALGQFDDKFRMQAVTGRIGYRYERPRGGFFMRLGFTPMYSLGGHEFLEKVNYRAFIPMVGVGLGWTLK